MFDRLLRWISDRPAITYMAAVLAIGTVVAVSADVFKRAELDRLFGPILVIAPGTLSATLGPEGRAQPPGGEVPFRINFADINPSGVTISVQFRFSDGEYRSEWISSPLLLLLGRSEAIVDGRVERTVRAAARVAARWSTSIWLGR